MIRINYIGQFGNCMFQYAFARLLALHNKMNLGTHGPLEINCTTVPSWDEPMRFETRTIDDIFYFNHRKEHGSTIPTLNPNCDYVVSGYFQDADLFNNNVNTVCGFFDIQQPAVEDLINKTLVMVRLGDFNHSGFNSEIIHYNWYQKVFKNITKQKDFTITSNGRNPVGTTEEQEQKYLSKIISEKDEVLPARSNMIEEFNEALSYREIVCSNSTWAWWVSFLSKAEKIFTFSQFGSFGVEEVKTHGVHVNNLYNIRNITHTIEGDFIDISKI